ncbi:MAG: efflux RND transporter periplasmic adaptor subunit [Deltaproteobacteria bacterium]|nr:efflux RND transporter periplasmic adaptor subunit [Deltaproteobacteria bacterium]
MTTNKNTSKKQLLAGLISGMILVGTSACNPTVETTAKAGSVEKAPVEAPPPIVSIQEIKPESHNSKITATGTALPVRASFLSASVPGLIMEIQVKRGDRVKKNQVLLRLDAGGFALGVQQAEAGLAAAEVGVRTVERELKRFTRLRQSKAVPGATVDKVQAQHDGAVAQRDLAAVGLRMARRALRDATQRAPYDGVITMVLKEVGEYAPAMPPTMLMKLVDTSSLEVQAFLPEREATFAKVGAQARVRIDSADVERVGQVIFVSDAIDPGVQNFEIRVSVDNADGAIKAGAFARLEILRQKIDQALLIPKQAIARDQKDQPYVLAEHDGILQRIPVKLGEHTDTRSLVLEGLKPGQRIVTSGLADLRHGQKVRVRAATQKEGQ